MSYTFAQKVSQSPNMNDPLIAIDALERLLTSTRSADASFHPGIFSAMTIIVQDLANHAEEDDIPGSAYICEKTLGLEWNLRAMFGFDSNNGHGFDSHYSWAYGNIQTLRSIFQELKGS